MRESSVTPHASYPESGSRWRAPWPAHPSQLGQLAYICEKSDVAAYVPALGPSYAPPTCAA